MRISQKGSSHAHPLSLGLTSVSTYRDWRSNYRRKCTRWVREKVSIGQNLVLQFWNSEGRDARQFTPLTGQELLYPSTIDSETWSTYIRSLDREWTDKNETDQLFALFRSCGGRWPVIYDRWRCDTVLANKGRTLEALISRFVKVSKKLLELDRRPPNCLPISIIPVKFKEIVELQRKAWIEQELKKFPNQIEMDQKLLKDFLRSRIKLRSSSSLGSSSSPTIPVQSILKGAFLTSIIAKLPFSEFSPLEQERVHQLADLIDISIFPRNRTLRVSRAASIVQKQLHMLIILKELTLAKQRELELLSSSSPLSPLASPSLPPVTPVQTLSSQNSLHSLVNNINRGGLSNSTGRVRSAAGNPPPKKRKQE